MTFLLAVAAIPLLYWPKGPDTAPALKGAGIAHIAVPQALANSWNGRSGVTATAVDAGQMINIPAPSVNFQMENASATREPWVESNGWRFLRQPNGKFHYKAMGKSAAMAAAEAFSYDAAAVVETDETGLKPLADMIRFLESLPPADMTALCNFDYIDDGTPASAEFMNLLIRSNLLFKVVKVPASGTEMSVALGSREYPQAEASNPKLLAEKVRAAVTDEKRLLRIYGSYVVIGRLTGTNDRRRVFLLNYGGAKSNVDGVRIRVLGKYQQYKVSEFQESGVKVSDYKAAQRATEVTLANMSDLTVVDLRQ